MKSLPRGGNNGLLGRLRKPNKEKGWYSHQEIEEPAQIFNGRRPSRL